MLRLNRVRTLNDAAQLWIDAHEELWDYTLILSCDGEGGGLPWPARLDLNGKAYIRSIFSRSRLWFVNRHILEEMARDGGHVNIPVDYSISFDTNAANYLRTMVEGKSPEIIDVFREVMRTLSGKSFNWDIMPFLRERSRDVLAGDPAVLDHIWRTVYATEYFAGCDAAEFARSGALALTVPESQVTAKSQDILGSFHRLETRRAQSGMDRDFALFYAFVLKIAAIERQLPGRSTSGKKLLMLLEFFHSEVSAMFLNVLWAGASFFQQGSQFRPLQKLSATGENLLRNAANIAWDFHHVTMMRQYATTIGRDRSFMVPYLLTFDRGIADLMDGFANRSCLIKTAEEFPAFIPDINVEQWFHINWPHLNEHIHNYFSADALKSREARRAQRGSFDPYPVIPRLKAQLASYG